MIVSIGQFYLKQRNLLPEFLQLSKAIHQEALDSFGNLKSELNNEGIAIFYSYTYWNHTEDVMHFVQSKTHGKILKDTERLCSKACFLRYETDSFEAIEVAKAKLTNSPNTRVFHF